VYEGHVIIAGDAVAECAEPLVYPLHHNLIRQAVADVLQLLQGHNDTAHSTHHTQQNRLATATNGLARVLRMPVSQGCHKDSRDTSSSFATHMQSTETARR
jgi:hypothetical protein